MDAVTPAAFVGTDIAPRIICWPETPARWTGERWVEYHLTREAANAALLRCRMWIASHDPLRITIRRAPCVEVQQNFEANRLEYRVYARLNVRVE